MNYFIEIAHEFLIGFLIRSSTSLISKRMIAIIFLKVNHGILIMNGRWDLLSIANFEFNREMLNFVALRYGLERP